MAAPYLVVFAPEAAVEVTAIAAWWRKHRLAAPGMFQQELKQALLNIAAFPEIGVRAKMPADPDVRAVVLRRTVAWCSTMSITPRRRSRSCESGTVSAVR